MKRMILSARAMVVALLALNVIGCATTLRVRIDEPAGATLAILGRASLLSSTEDTVELRLPFVAEMDSGGDSLGYPVRLTLPPDVAARFGAVGTTRLFGTLFVYSPTRVSGLTGVVTLRIPADRLSSLLRGEVAVIETFVTDPNEVPQRYLVRLELRASAS